MKSLYLLPPPPPDRLKMCFKWKKLDMNVITVEATLPLYILIP
jgi:hypothetical protein